MYTQAYKLVLPNLDYIMLVYGAKTTMLITSSSSAAAAVASDSAASNSVDGWAAASSSKPNLNDNHNEYRHVQVMATCKTTAYICLWLLYVCSSRPQQLGRHPRCQISVLFWHNQEQIAWFSSYSSIIWETYKSALLSAHIRLLLHDVFAMK